MRKLIFALLCLLLIFSGCESKKEEVTPTQDAKQAVTAVEPVTEATPLLKQPIDPVLVEYPTQALTVWRKFQAAKPALVLLSKDPFLAHTPTELKNTTKRLLQQGSDQTLLDRVSYPRSNPSLLPLMAVSSALESGFFSEMIWVFPATVDKESLNGKQFIQQLVDFGAIDSREAETLSYEAGVLSGAVRGLPFRAAHPDALPSIQGPVVLHLDLSFFQPYYKGEVKTPIFPLLYEKLRSVRDAGWKAVAVTVSYSTLTGQIPLASRFIGPTLAKLFTKPEKLDQPLPELWQQRANALYLPNFFRTEETRDLYLIMESTHPEDASVKYGLYEALRETKEGAKALQALEQAVAIDPVYGLEYLKLAPLAQEKSRIDEAIRMMTLATETFPDNPFITLQLAKAFLTMGHGSQAVPLLKKLEKLPWSPVYYPEMPDQLEAMKAAAEKAAETD